VNEDVDLTRSEGEPTPRSTVRFVRTPVDAPLGLRLVNLLLAAIAQAISGTICILAVAAINGPTWLMAVVGVAGMCATMLTRLTWQSSDQRKSAPGGHHE
jgi:hypothetical protein